MTTVLPIDPHTDPRWLEFLARHPGSTIFHHPQWIRALETTYRYRPCSFGFVEEGRLTGLLPLLEIRSWLTGARGVSLPFSDFGGPLITSNATLRSVADHCRSLLAEKHWKYVEFRGDVEIASTVAGQHFKRHRLQLGKDTDAVFRGFDKSQTQRSVRKAEKSGVVVERSTDPHSMDEFVRLNYITRKKHGMPPQPSSFFRNVHKFVIGTGLGFVSLARIGNAVAAAAVYLTHNDTVYYKFGASDESLLKSRPNHALMWDAIRWGCEHGFKNFDFGRTDLDNEGLLEYKRGWGTVETDVVYRRFLGAATDAQAIGEQGLLEKVKPVFRRMPIPVLKIIGKVLYGHVG